MAKTISEKIDKIKLSFNDNGVWVRTQKYGALIHNGIIRMHVL